jgi:uncharacterized membrane protein YhaH (DUF805 family)
LTFQQAIRSGFNNYTNFKDRSSRSEYWYWALFAFLAGIAGSIIDMVLGTNLIQIVVSLALFIPGLAVGVRRLHDVGKSGWNLLWLLLPILGLIYLIYLFVQPSQSAPNNYGTAPLAPAAA